MLMYFGLNRTGTLIMEYKKQIFVRVISYLFCGPTNSLNNKKHLETRIYNSVKHLKFMLLLKCFQIKSGLGVQ